MRALATFITMLALIGSASAQDPGAATVSSTGDLKLASVTYPTIAATAARRAEIVPSGWNIEAEAAGDLDRDGRRDLALVLQNPRPAAAGLPGPRMLVIAFGAVNGYDRIIENHNLIKCIDAVDVVDCFDASSGDLAMQNGQLIVGLNFFAGTGAWEMWTKSYTFNWRGGRFELDEFVWSVIHRSTGETTNTFADFANHMLTVWKGNIAVDAQTSTQTALAAGESILLEDIADGMAFDPLSVE